MVNGRGADNSGKHGISTHMGNTTDADSDPDTAKIPDPHVLDVQYVAPEEDKPQLSFSVWSHVNQFYVHYIWRSCPVPVLFFIFSW